MSAPIPAERLAEFRGGGPVTTHTRTSRAHHQILAACVVALIVSGFSLQSAAVARIGRQLGGAWVLGWVHRGAAIVLVAMFVHHVATIVVPVVVRAIRAAARSTGGVVTRIATLWRGIPLLPDIDDARDALHTARYFAGFEPHDHRAGRWHYRSKLHYMAIVWGVPAMGITGLVMALPVVVPGKIAALLGVMGLSIEPRTVVAIAETVHSHEAWLVVAISVVWHGYRVLFPVRRDIFTGSLSLEEMRRWHPRWYDEYVEAAGHDPLSET